MGQVTTNHPDVVEVAFVPTVDDQVYVINEAERASRGQRWWILTLLSILVLANVVRVWSEGLAGLFGVPALLLLGMAVVAYVHYWPGVLARWALARHARTHPAAFSPVAYTFSADGVRIESKLGTTELPWSSFTGARETKNQFLLSYATGQHYFVPRRALRESDEPRLRTLLQAHLGARAEFMKTNGR